VAVLFTFLDETVNHGRSSTAHEGTHARWRPALWLSVQHASPVSPIIVRHGFALGFELLSLC